MSSIKMENKTGEYATLTDPRHQCKEIGHLTSPTNTRFGHAEPVFDNFQNFYWELSLN